MKLSYQKPSNDFGYALNGQAKGTSRRSTFSKPAKVGGMGSAVTTKWSYPELINLRKELLLHTIIVLF